MKKGRVKGRNYKVPIAGQERMFQLRYGEKFKNEHDGLWPSDLKPGALPVRLSPFKWAFWFQHYFDSVALDPETFEVKMTECQSALMGRLSRSISECFAAKTGSYLRELASAIEALTQDLDDNNLARLYVDGLPRDGRINASQVMKELRANNVRISDKTLRRIVRVSGRKFLEAGRPKR